MKPCLLAFPALCVFNSFVVAATIRVPSDAPTIQMAIEMAQPQDSILVAPGTYAESINFLGKAITVRSVGGPDVTTIDGTGQLGSVITCASGEGPDTLLDGFTITGGSGSLISGTRYGGGMLNYFSNPTVLNCNFLNNGATRGGGVANYKADTRMINCKFFSNSASEGGGLYNRLCSPAITDCLFDQNESGSGVFTFSPNGYLPTARPVIRDCTFTRNAPAGLIGGGELILNSCLFEFNAIGVSVTSGSAHITGCAFRDNSGAGLATSYSDVMISDSIFMRNSGTGMSNIGSGNRQVSNCTFSENSAELPTGSGGGIFNGRYVIATITRCTFSGNTAHVGGGISNDDSDATITQCVFQANRASEGGGIYNRQQYNGNQAIRIVNCSFVANAASLWGGGVRNYVSRPALTSCTLAANKAEGTRSVPGGGGVYGGGMLENCIFWGDFPNEATPDSNALDVKFCCIRGGFPLGAVNAGGNIFVDPSFVRPPGPGPDGAWGGSDDDLGNLRLGSDSPCIDAGDSAYGLNPENPIDDLDGGLRIVGVAVDLGAFESQGTQQNEWPDFDKDGIPDFRDFDIDGDGIVNSADDCDYTPLGVSIDSEGRPRADLNHDCKVDLADFAIMQLDIFGP